MTGFEKLMHLLNERYYGDLIMGVSELIAIIIGLVYVRKDKTGVFFIAYLIFDFFILVYASYLEVFSSLTKHEYSFFLDITNCLISLSELLVYYYFFLKIINKKNIVKLMKILRMIFIAIMIIFIATGFSFLTHRHSYISLQIEVIEFLFLIPPCFIYFIELLKNDPIINLYERPSFWIVTGVFFYCLVSIPYYLINQFVFQHENKSRDLIILLLFDIPICINSIFLTRAFLCKKTLTT